MGRYSGKIVLAAMHSGVLGGLPPLSECRGVSNKKGDFYGVEGPAHIDASGQKIYRYLLTFKINGEKYRLFRHPQYFISEDLKAWYSKYSMIAPITYSDYENIPALWYDNVNIYEKYLAKFREAQNNVR